MTPAATIGRQSCCYRSNSSRCAKILPANHANARESQRRALSKTILISAVVKPPVLWLFISVYSRHSRAKRFRLRRSRSAHSTLNDATMKSLRNLVTRFRQDLAVATSEDCQNALAEALPLLRRCYQRNYLSPVPAVNLEIGVQRNDDCLVQQLAHPDQTGIRQ